MNRIEKLERLRDLADELDLLQQELSQGMNIHDNEVYDRHAMLEEIREDAEKTLDSISFWVAENRETDKLEVDQ